jgi:hypothetical protein
MHYGSVTQLRAVAGSCKQYNSKISGALSGEISCASCNNWDGVKCKIGVYDKVLTSLDQT